MRIIRYMGVAGLLLFLAGGSLEAEPGAAFEWVPYAAMCTGLLLILAFILVKEAFYFGEE